MELQWLFLTQGLLFWIHIITQLSAKNSFVSTRLGCVVLILHAPAVRMACWKMIEPTFRKTRFFFLYSVLTDPPFGAWSSQWLAHDAIIERIPTMGKSFAVCQPTQGTSIPLRPNTVSITSTLTWHGRQHPSSIYWWRPMGMGTYAVNYCTTPSTVPT